MLFIFGLAEGSPFTSSQHPQLLATVAALFPASLVSSPPLPLDFRDKSLKAQGYQLQVLQQAITIYSSDYAGKYYALIDLHLDRHFSRNFTNKRVEPAGDYRGLMIDTARHFLSVKAIKRTLDMMSLSKLNSLHWHITDDESFPIELPSVPELQNSGKFSMRESYSVQEVKEIVAYAKARAIQIIPQIDSPGHVRSWGLNPKFRDITIQNCPGGQGYNAQLDLSNKTTYEVGKSIIKDLQELFTDQYLHLGGDEVFASCFDLRPSIKTFMKLHNIQNYGQLQDYWRGELRQVVQSNRSLIFWRNNADGVSTSPSDIIQFWGSSADISKVAIGTKSRLILSQSDLLYLNKGVGFIYGNDFGQYSPWETIYQQFTLTPEGVDPQQILGGEVCLWGEVSNQDTLDNYLWMRASAFALKAFQGKTRPLAEARRMLYELLQIMISNGVDASPLHRQYIESMAGGEHQEKARRKIPK